MARLNSQFVVVEQEEINFNQVVQNAALFNPDGTPYAGGESSPGGGTDLSAIGTFSDALNYGIPGFVDPDNLDESKGWVGLSTNNSGELTAGYGDHCFTDVWASESGTYVQSIFDAAARSGAGIFSDADGNRLEIEAREDQEGPIILIYPTNDRSHPVFSMAADGTITPSLGGGGSLQISSDQVPTFQGFWDEGTSYSVGDWVIADEEGIKSYICILDTVGGSPTDENWQFVDTNGQALQVRGQVHPDVFGNIDGSLKGQISEPPYGYTHDSVHDVFYRNDGTQDFPVFTEITPIASSQWYVDPGNAVAGDAYVPLTIGGPPTGTDQEGFDAGWYLVNMFGVAYRNDGTSEAPTWNVCVTVGADTTPPSPRSGNEGDTYVQYNQPAPNYYTLWLKGAGDDTDWTDVSSTTLQGYFGIPHDGDEGEATYDGIIIYVFLQDSPAGPSGLIAYTMSPSLEDVPVDGRQAWGVPAPLGTVFQAQGVSFTEGYSFIKTGTGDTDWSEVTTGLEAIGEFIDNVDWWSSPGWVPEEFGDDSHSWFAIDILGGADIAAGFGNDDEFPGRYSEIFASAAGVGFDAWNSNNGEIYGLVNDDYTRLLLIAVPGQTDEIPILSIKDESNEPIFSVFQHEGSQRASLLKMTGHSGLVPFEADIQLRPKGFDDGSWMAELDTWYHPDGDPGASYIEFTMRANNVNSLDAFATDTLTYFKLRGISGQTSDPIFEIKDGSNEVIFSVSEDGTIVPDLGGSSFPDFTATGSPQGVVTAERVGQYYADSSSGALWVSLATDDNHWRIIGGGATSLDAGVQFFGLSEIAILAQEPNGGLYLSDLLAADGTNNGLYWHSDFGTDGTQVFKVKTGDSGQYETLFNPDGTTEFPGDVTVGGLHLIIHDQITDDDSFFGLNLKANNGDLTLDTSGGSGLINLTTGGGSLLLAADGHIEVPGDMIFNATTALVFGSQNLHVQAANALSLIVNNVAAMDIGDGTIGFHGATPVAQAAHPADITDVIAILTALGLCAP